MQLCSILFNKGKLKKGVTRLIYTQSITTIFIKENVFIFVHSNTLHTKNNFKYKDKIQNLINLQYTQVYALQTFCKKQW